MYICLVQFFEDTLREAEALQQLMDTMTAAGNRAARGFLMSKVGRQQAGRQTAKTASCCPFWFQTLVVNC
jgi:hypothetical protein